MILTEAEARQKWCPFVRFHGPDSVGNRDTRFDNGGAFPSGCIGSACMAWRKMESEEFNATALKEFRKTGYRVSCDTGFCGLAGKP